MSALLWLCGVALALTLEEAREAAARQSLALERARATADQAQAATWSTLSASLPAVTAFASLNTGAGLTPFGFPRPVRTQTGLGLEGSWQVVDPSGWAAAGAARANAQGQEAMVDWALVEARRQATAAYALALAAQQRAEVLEQSHADARRAAEATAALVHAGLRPEVDAQRLLAEAETARALWIQAQGDARARCAELQGLVREPLTGTCTLAPPSWGAPLTAPGEHPALRAAEAALVASRRLTQSEALGAAPSVGASGTVARYAVDDGAGVGWSVSVEATQPLLAGGAAAAQLDGARAAERAAQIELESQEQALDIARISAEARLEAAQAGLEAQRAARAAAERAFADLDSQHRAGLVGDLEWLEARRARDQAALGEVAAQAEQGLALAEVEAARGVW